MNPFYMPPFSFADILRVVIRSIEGLPHYERCWLVIVEHTINSQVVP